MRCKHLLTLRRTLGAFIVAGFLTAFSAGQASAGDAATAAASCDPGVQQILQDNANATRVRDSALAHEIIQHSDASAGLTCMDQAMGVTGRLGNTFSDRHDDLVPPANTVVFTPPLAYPDWGAGDFLVTQLNDAIIPMLGVHLGSNFGGTMGALLGFNSISSQFTGLIDSIMGPITDIGGQIAGFSSDINSILSAIETIQTLAKALNLPLPSPVIIGAVAALEAAQVVAAQLMNAMQMALNAAVQPLIGQVMGEIMGPAAEMDCDNIGTLWNGAEDNPSAMALQGTGNNLGAPFLPIAALVQGVAVHGGQGFVNQLQSPQNMEVLTRALANLTEGGLSRPGVLRSWKEAPSFGRTATTEEILQEMRVAQ